MEEVGELKSPSAIFPEQRAIAQAIAAIDRGAHDEALSVILTMLATRRAPTRGPDTRSTTVVRLRGYMEKARDELNHKDPWCARRTLERALAGRSVDKNMVPLGACLGGCCAETLCECSLSEPLAEAADHKNLKTRATREDL